MEIINSKKHCSDCGVELLESNYVLQPGRNKFYVTKRCKKCRSAWTQGRKSEEQKDKEKSWVALRYAERRATYLRIKRGVCCIDCGIKDYRVIDWHHIDPATKLFGISDYLTGKGSIEDLYYYNAKSAHPF